MLRIGTSVKGFDIDATDGRIGTVSDLLFDDKSWKVRWLVADTGSWLTGRKVLLHPSSISQINFEDRILSVTLTKAKVKDSPDILQDQPVSRQMQYGLYDYYDWDPMWGGSVLERGVPPLPFTPSPFVRRPGGREFADADSRMNEGDPDLRSLNAVTGYHIEATDGAIGHLEDIVIEDAGWTILYLIVDTRNWWPGQHVLLSPHTVRNVSWEDHQLQVDVTREMVRASPPWDPMTMIDSMYQSNLHKHYNWPNYGW